MKEAGFIDGENVVIEYRWAEDRNEQMAALVADLVRRQVAAIVPVSTPAALAAKAATSTIPIIFAVGGDPVGSGLVRTLNRPDSNITGSTFISTGLDGKRFELLHELVPTAAVVGAIVNPTNPNAEEQTKGVQAAAAQLGLQLHLQPASSGREIDIAFRNLTELRVQAVHIGGDTLFGNRRAQLVVLSARYVLPASYNAREDAMAGGLLSYGANQIEAYRQTGIYVGKVLKGTNPADLPVMQPTKFEWVINLSTAKALGIEVPGGLLARADEVIE